MVNPLDILLFNLRNRIKNNLPFNVLATISIVLIAAFLLMTDRLHPELVIFYLLVFATVSSMSAIDKNVNLSILVEFPVAFQEIIDILSLKFITTNILLGSFLMGLSSFFIEYSVYEWMNLLFSITYVTLIFFFTIEVILRKRLGIDMLCVALAVIVAATTVVLLSLLYGVSGPSLTAFNIGLVLLYHTRISRLISAHALKGIYEILERA